MRSPEEINAALERMYAKERRRDAIKAAVLFALAVIASVLIWIYA